MSAEVEFDRVAPTYDETRRAPTDDELRTLVELLPDCRSVVDGGVGTGRFAAPLRARGFDVLGVDLSLAMMQRARAKGLTALVRADLRRLPLRDGAADAAFTSHVLQLVPEPSVVLRELARIAQRKVVVLLPERPHPASDDRRAEFYRRYRSIAGELGYALPERGPRFWHTLEDLTRVAVPELVRVMEQQPPALTDGAVRGRSDPASWFGRMAVPPEVHAEILRRLGSENRPERSGGNRPRTERFIVWEPAVLRNAQPLRPNDATERS
jgi:ubiquinone/menaquinone biosynthesis C-methylase UbiE